MSEQLKSSTFEELYLQQKKKSSMLLIAVIVLAIATAGSLAWGISKSNNSQNQAGGPGQGFSSQGGPGGMMGGFDVKQFFKDDGSVDTDEVKSFLDRMPSQGRSDSGSSSTFLDRFKENISQSVEDGDITQDQADALIEALETESGS